MVAATEAIAALYRGRGGVLLVEGQSGHGKTRMLDEIATLATRDGVRVGRGTYSSAHGGARMEAFLTALFSGPDPLVRETGAQHDTALDAIATTLADLAPRVPVLVALDDMHWVDPSGRHAMVALPERLVDIPILWVYAFRGDGLGSRDVEVYRNLDDLGGRRLVLGPLDESAMRLIAEDVLSASPEASLRDEIESTRGNPFLLLELLRNLQDDGLLRSVSGRVRFVGPPVLSRPRDLGRDPLSRVSARARSVARAASVIGGAFSLQWLAYMFESPPSAVSGAVEELSDAGVLRHAQEQLVFRHELLREAVLRSVPRSTGRALQRQAADALMATGAAPLEVATLLVDSAQRGDAKAVAVLTDAVRELGPHDPDAAADLGRRALQISTNDDPHRGTLVADTVVLLYAADRPTDGQEFAEEALDGADEALGAALPNEEQAAIRLSVAQMYSISGDVRIANGRRALALADISPALRARHLVWLSHNLLGAGRVAEARVAIRDAELQTASANDDQARFRLSVVAATVHHIEGRYGQALSEIEPASQLAAARQGPSLDVGLRALLAETLAAMGRHEEALDGISASLRQAQRDRHGYGVRTWEQYRGRRLFELGRLEEAASALQGAVVVGALPPGLRNVDAPAVVALGRSALHLGDARRGTTCHRLAQTMLGEGTPEVRRHAAWLLMLQALAASDLEALRDALEQLGDDARESVLPQVRFDVADPPQLVRAARAIGDESLAARAVDLARERHQRNPDVPLLKGLAYHARGLRDDDAQELAVAADLLAATDRRLAHASALEDLGRAWLTRGERVEAIASLGRALDVYVACGATWDVGRVRGRLRALGVRRRPARPARRASGWRGLTDPELNVARLVALGLTNRAVATQMFLSPHTVDMHLRSVFAKLEINSRAELTRMAQANDRGFPLSDGPAVP